MRKYRKAIIAITLGIIASIMFTSMGAFAKECSDIRQRVFRLHILANSDSKADQQLKLKVRDEVLRCTSGMFSTENVEKAKVSARKNIPYIESIARRVIKEEGFDYPVKAEVVNMFFDIRRYGEISMPAGKYDALRITIGDAAGKNWWCVMYPPICLPAAQPKKQLSDVLTSTQTDIVEHEQEYEVRFKIVEIFESIKNALFG